MNSIIVYPKNEKQQSLLKSLLEEMKIRFEIEKGSTETELSKEDFMAKIDKSVKQAASGKTMVLTPEAQKRLLGL